VRAAAIFGPNASEKDLRAFQRCAEIISLSAVSPGMDAALIFGGDGTVHRHLQALVSTQIPALMVPSGSGNDFSKALGLSSRQQSFSAWKKFCSGAKNVRAIDLGCIAEMGAAHPSGAPSSSFTYFCCVAGVGLDAAANRIGNAMPRWLRAHGGYVLSALAALVSYTPQAVSVSLHDGNSHPASAPGFSGPAMLVAFANAPSYGGGMRIAPQAQLADGKLDICFVKKMSRLRLLRFFPKVFSGEHLQMPQVDYRQAERFRIETASPSDVYADGEYICRTPIAVRIQPAALRVIVP